MIRHTNPNEMSKKKHKIVADTLFYLEFEKGIHFVFWIPKLDDSILFMYGGKHLFGRRGREKQLRVRRGI